MPDPHAVDLKTAAAIAEHLATVIALLVGGSWVLYQYVIRRSGETGLSIEVSTATSSRGDGRLVFVDVALKNTGQRRLDASLASSPQLAGEFDRSVRYAGSLQLRQIARVPDGALAHVDWWDEKSGLLGALTVPEVKGLLINKGSN